MLRFFSRFQADFQLTSGWIEPLLVGGHAPFSPAIAKEQVWMLLVYDGAYLFQGNLGM